MSGTVNMMACASCGAPLDWKGRCQLCVGFDRLRGTIAAAGGFKTARRQRRKARAWSGNSGVDSAVPKGDRE
jgi:predicted ATP-dependent serine protease